MTEPLEDVTLTLHVLRPDDNVPAGKLKLTAQFVREGKIVNEVATSGPCDVATLERAFTDMLSYLQTGKKSHVNRIDPGKNGHGDGRDTGFLDR